MNAEIDISQVTLQTDRLILRSWKESDLEDFYEYAKVDGVGQMAGWLPHKDREESAKILQLFISEKKTFAIEYDGKVIGSLGIELYDEKKFPEFQELADGNWALCCPGITGEEGSCRRRFRECSGICSMRPGWIS